MPALRGDFSAMVLEDEPRYRAFLSEVLREMGGRAVPAATAAEAMRLVQSGAPDMLLLDLNLPVTDGIRFLEQFRGLCPKAPVVIITGFGDLESAQRAIRLGVTEFLTKPCDLGQLESAIDRARRRIPTHAGIGADDGVSVEPKPEGANDQSLAAVERDAIIAALRESGGNRSAAARQLGISRRSLYNKILEYARQGHDVP